MKRCATQRIVIAAHEAGHVVAIALTKTLQLGDFTWHRLRDYEIIYAEPKEVSKCQWEDGASRNALIAHQAAVALAGGAAERVMSAAPEGLDTVNSIHEQVGKVDFELAHEWLTLQRYDPDQQALEREIQLLFSAVSELMRLHTEVLTEVTQRILTRLRLADTRGENYLRFPATDLLENLDLKPDAVEFSLKATLKQNTDRRSA